MSRVFRGALVGIALATLTSLATPAWGQVDQSPLEPVRYEGHKVVRVEMRNTRDVRTMLTLSDDPWSCGWDGVSPGRISFRIAPGAMAAIQASGMKYKVLVDDVQKLIDSEHQQNLLRDPSWFADYKSYADVDTYLNSLVTLRPDLASRVAVPGNSIEGRALQCIRISSAAPGTKPAVVLIGCQHAREWITVMTTMYLADQLVTQYDTDAALKKIVDNFEVFIIPIANVDGYVYTWASSNNRLWRKNRRPNVGGTFGVDLNRNWNYQWMGPGNSTSPGSDIYRGTAPFSEPETTAISNFISARTNTTYFFDIHSFSEFVLEPWGWDFSLPPDTLGLHQYAVAVQSGIYNNGGTVYYAGETYRTIYPASGISQDWTYGAKNIVSLALELRGNAGDSSGFVLPAAQIIPTGTEFVGGFKAAMQWAFDNAIAIVFRNDRPTVVPAGSGTNVQVAFNRGSLAIVSPSPLITVSTRQGRTGAFTTLPVTNAGTDETGTVYSHTLTGGICGSVVQWYYTVPIQGGGFVTIPAGGASAPYEAVANTWSTVFSDDFETDKGWLRGDPSSPDTATSGLWTTAPTGPLDPNGYQANPESDYTPLSGTKCIFTGNAARQSASNFVQGGKTTLRSPVLDLSAAPNSEISFWLWFFNDRQFPPLDPFVVDITNNALSGAPTWVQAINIAGAAPPDQTTGGWRKYTIKVPQFVTPTSQVQIRLVATAAASVQGNWIEAGIDDAAVISYSCSKTPCPGDFNGDGMGSVQDIFDFLAAYFSASASADFNHSGLITTQDIFDFLGAWFAGCP